jgi:hypothetical protein
MPHTYSLVFSLLAATLAAQNTVVSPTRAATIGGGGNTYPWSQSAMHYMQVHSDIKGTFRLVTKLAFRMAPGTSSYTGTRAIDLEMLMGNSVGYDEVLMTYAANYVGTPQTVVVRKTINMGPQGTQGQPTSPFTGMDVPLDTPYPYIGINSLAWEARIYANVATGSFNASDAFSSSAASGTSTTIGAGCVPSGKSAPMALAALSYQTINHLTLILTLTGAPNTAPTALAIGTTNPATSLPEICGLLHTDFALMLPMGLTDASGAIPRGGSGSLLFKNNPAPSATFYAQFHSLDAGSTMPVPVANSNGVQMLLPSVTPTTITEVTRLYLAGNATGPAATLDTFGVIGYAIATQFHY